MKDGRNAGFAAISLLLALLVIALIAFTVIGYLSGRSGRVSAGASRPIERARTVECLGQARRIEMQVQFYSVQYGRFPERLDMFEGLVETDLRCPVTQNRYGYDPQSGRVLCPDHPR
ncbi:hypothetical protein IBX73_06240 [candidate division WOR-3 bacterium]|nr:hypothetical protein [candidate division WOR-3 bacterium]